MAPVRLLQNFSDLYSYSLWKMCHPVRTVIQDCTFIRDIRASDLGKKKYQFGIISFG